MNTAIRSLISARIASAIAATKAVGNVKHSGLKGLMREILVRELLAPVLPPNAGIGHGEIVDSYDNHSAEQDVVIYDKTIIPAVLLDATNGIFPIESVIYSIEVKSKIDATQLQNVHQSAKGLLKMLHDGRPKGPGTGNSDIPIEHVIPCLFAFSSDLSGDRLTELKRYKETAGENGEGLRSICVVGKGYWYFSANRWHSVAPTSEHSEIIEFLAHISAAYSRVVRTRTAPPLTHYLIDR